MTSNNSCVCYFVSTLHFFKFTPNEHTLFPIKNAYHSILNTYLPSFCTKLTVNCLAILAINFKRYLSLNNTEGVFYCAITFLLKFLVIYYSCTYLLKCQIVTVHYILYWIFYNTYRVSHNHQNTCLKYSPLQLLKTTK